MIRRWLASPHLRPIASIASGAALAQVLGILVAPLITRLYAPSDYGTVAIYGSFVAIGAAVATGRYEGAASLPPEDERGERDAIALVRLALVVAAGVSGTALLGVTATHLIGDVPALGELGPWALAIPWGVFTTAASATLSAYATRRRAYGTIARVPLMQKLISSSVQVVGGFLKLGVAGLMLGAIVTPLVGLGILLRNYRNGKQQLPDPAWRWPDVRRVASRYSDFPRVGTWFALLNALAWNVQAIALARFYSISDVGQYALATAIIGLPTRMVLAGVSQVYLRESAARVDDPVAARRLASGTVRSLLIVSIPLFAAIFAAGKYLFGIIFGPDWVDAGAIAVAMIPLLWPRFLTTSLTATFTVYRRQGLLLTWQIVALGATLLGIVLGGTRGLPIVNTTLIVSLLVGPLYLLLIPMAFRAIRGGAAPPGTPSP